MAANCFQLSSREDDDVLKIVNVSVSGTIVSLYLENKQYIRLRHFPQLFYWMYLRENYF